MTSDLFVAALVGFFFYPFAEWLFRKWLDRPRRIRLDMHDTCIGCKIPRSEGG